MPKKIIANLTLLAATIIAFIVFLEIALRLFYPQNLNPEFLPTTNLGTFSEYDQILGWKLKPGAEGYLFSGEFKTYVKNNAQGMRMSRNITQQKSKYRIAVLGDSMIWGFGVEESDRVSENLERQLKNAEVLNFGVSGYGTDQEYLQLNKTVLKFQPDMVIIAFYANDLEDAGNSIRYDYPKPLFKLKNNTLELTNVPVPKRENWEDRTYPISTKINLYLSHKSHAFVFFKPLFREINSILSPRKRVLPEPDTVAIIKKNYSEDYQRYEKLNDKLYCEISNVLRQRNTTFVVFNIPAKGHIFPKLLRNGLDKYHINEDDIDINKTSKMLYNLSQNCGFYFIDFYPYFRNYKEKEKLYFKIDAHWSKEGHKYASEILFKKLKEYGLVK